MLRFEMEAPIVMETEDDIAQALRDIADQIESGTGRGFVPGEVQCAEWFVGTDNFDEENSFYDEDDERYADEYGYDSN